MEAAAAEAGGLEARLSRDKCAAAAPPHRRAAHRRATALAHAHVREEGWEEGGGSAAGEGAVREARESKVGRKGGRKGEKWIRGWHGAVRSGEVLLWLSRLAKRQ